MSFDGNVVVNTLAPLANVVVDATLNLYQPLQTSNLTVNGADLLDSSGVGRDAVDVSGLLTLYAPVIGNGFISLNGSADQTVSAAPGTYLTNLNIANTTSSILLDTNLELRDGALTGSGHIVDAGTGNSGTLQLGADGDSVVTDFHGTIDDLVLDLKSQLINYQPLNVTDSLTVPTTEFALIYNNAINVAGNVTVDALVGGFAGLNLTGTTQTLEGTGYVANLNVAGGTVLLPANFIIIGSLSGSGHFENEGGLGGPGTLQFGQGADTVDTDFTGSIDDLVLDLNGTLDNSAPLTVNNTLTDVGPNGPAGATIYNDPLDVAGNVTIDSYVDGDGYLNLTGTTQTLAGSGYVTNLNVAGGTVVLPANFILQNGTLSGSGHFENGGGLGGAGTLQFGQGDNDFTTQFSGTIDDLVLDLNGYLSNNQPLVVNNTLTDDTLDGAAGVSIYEDPVDVSGNVTIDSYVNGYSYLNLTGTTQILAGTGYITNLNVAGGTVVLPANFILRDGTLSGSGHFENEGGLGGAGTLQFGQGDNDFTTQFSGSIDDLVLDLNDTLTNNQPLLVNNTLTDDGLYGPAGVTINNDPIDVSGNVTIDSYVNGNSYLNLTGTTQTLAGSGYVTNLNVAGGTVILPANFILQDDVVNGNDFGTLSGSGHFENGAGLGGAGTLQFGQGDNNYTTDFGGTIDDLVLDLNGTLTNNQPLLVNNSLVPDSSTIDVNPIVVAGVPQPYSNPVTYAQTTLLWTGSSGTDHNWSDPANWSILNGTDTTPQPGDTVIFNASSSVDSVIDQSFSIGTLVDSGYQGTITLGARR